MPAKNPQPNYSATVDQTFRDTLKVIGVGDINLLESLEGEERREFLAFCHLVFNNKFLKVIIQDHIQTQVMFTANVAISYEQYMGGKMMVEGIKTIYDFFERHAKQYEVEFNTAPENFDKRAAFSKAKI